MELILVPLPFLGIIGRDPSVSKVLRVTCWDLSAIVFLEIGVHSKNYS